MKGRIYFQKQDENFMIEPVITDAAFKLIVGFAMVLVGIGKIPLYKDSEKQTLFLHGRGKWFLWPGLFLIVLKMTDLMTK
jgi:hypothetical protein